MINYGVVLKKIRQEKNIPIKKASKLINKSVGWLSEVENAKGFAKIKADEFERIVKAYGEDFQPQKFSAWATHKTNSKKPSIQFDGAILKFLRSKSRMKLSEASKTLGFGNGYLSDIENGRKPVSVALRNRIMAIYNYSPSSFKNFNSEDKRSSNIPVKNRLAIVINNLDETSLVELLNFAIQKFNLKKEA